jgi:rhodanese-related sulfurtransferase
MRRWPLDEELPAMRMSVEEMLNEARAHVREVSASETKEDLEQGKVDVILDVREPQEWFAGHIPGAVYVPRGLLEWHADQTSPTCKPELQGKPDARIVVHCAAGGRSLLAARTLQEMGYTNVVSMVGGFSDWAAQGFPVERTRIGS